LDGGWEWSRYSASAEEAMARPAFYVGVVCVSACVRSRCLHAHDMKSAHRSPRDVRSPLIYGEVINGAIYFVLSISFSSPS